MDHSVPNDLGRENVIGIRVIEVDSTCARTKGYGCCVEHSRPHGSISSCCTDVQNARTC
ncbi:hypothetical protein PsAD13_04419 [Pseudovibrio sp. Ad13]|nr:hypothetical protein PsAD13_04419 [Pseudovibrio sp. Ad13]